MNNNTRSFGKINEAKSLKRICENKLKMKNKKTWTIIISTSRKYNRIKWVNVNTIIHWKVIISIHWCFLDVSISKKLEKQKMPSSEHADL